MEEISKVLLAIHGVGFLWLLWCFFANEITYRQRCKMLDDFQLYDDGWDIFRSVTYGKHHWYVCTFRNPYKLYEI